jgi:hypothetical protein
MSYRLSQFLNGMKKRFGFIIGGLLIVIDNIGRVQVIKDLWAELKIIWTTIHPIWPSHLLTWIGAGFVIFGLISTFWPKPPAPETFQDSFLVSPTNETEPASPPKAPEERVILGPNLTPRYFCEELKGKTGYQIERMTGMYVGKWMRFKGEISDIRSASDARFSITFQNGPGESYVNAIFAEKWSEHLSVMSTGEVISVLGKVREIERNWIWLVDCDLE